MRSAGLEPTTSSSGGSRSVRLSYDRAYFSFHIPLYRVLGHDVRSLFGNPELVVAIRTWSPELPSRLPLRTASTVRTQPGVRSQVVLEQMPAARQLAGHFEKDSRFSAVDPDIDVRFRVHSREGGGRTRECPRPKRGGLPPAYFSMFVRRDGELPHLSRASCADVSRRFRLPCGRARPVGDFKLPTIVPTGVEPVFTP